MDKKMQDLLDLLFESNKQYNIFKDNIKQSLSNFDKNLFDKSITEFELYLNRENIKNNIIIDKEKEKDNLRELNKTLIRATFDYLYSAPNRNIIEKLPLFENSFNTNILAYYLWFLEDNNNCRDILVSNKDFSPLTAENCEFLEQEFDHFKLSIADKVLNKNLKDIHNSFLEIQSICYNFSDISSNQQNQSNSLILKRKNKI